MRSLFAIAALFAGLAAAPHVARSQTPAPAPEEPPPSEAADEDEDAPAEPAPDEDAPAEPDAAGAEGAAPQPTEAEPSAPEPAEPEPTEPAPQGGDELPPEMRRQIIDDTEPSARAEAPAQPMRIVGRLGVGGALRLVAHDDFQQDRLAPSYLDLQGALVLPLAGALRHSVLVGASTNLEADGSFVSGVDPFQQWVFSAGYGLHVPFGRAGAPTWLVGGHVSGAVVVSPDLTWGIEVGGDAAYHFLAGLGVYAEVNVGTYFGAEDRFGNLTVNPLLALEVGLTWDYEVLP